MQAVRPVILEVIPEVRLFWELAQRSFARQLTYRAALLAGLATNLFFGFLRVAVTTALYGARMDVDNQCCQLLCTWVPSGFLHHLWRQTGVNITV